MYKHDDDCSFDPDAATPDPATCTCEPELVSCDDCLDESDLDEDALRQITEDAHAFYAAEIEDMRASTLDMSQCGHDFYLTRNRHGAGFWDRKHIDEDADAALDRLTKAAHAYGEQDFILGHDGKVSIA